MVTALLIIAYLAMGWLSVFYVEYASPHHKWDTIALWCCWLLWPVVAIMCLLAIAVRLLAFLINNLNPLRAAQKARALADRPINWS